jgi:hypothetical protein
MDRTKTTLERAFELAASGAYTNYTDMRTQLKTEGYDGRQLDGPSLRSQLRRIILKARTDTEPT